MSNKTNTEYSRLAFKLNAEVHKQLKLIAVQEDITLETICRDALNEWIEEYKIKGLKK